MRIQANGGAAAIADSTVILSIGRRTKAGSGKNNESGAQSMSTKKLAQVIDAAKGNDGVDMERLVRAAVKSGVEEALAAQESADNEPMQKKVMRVLKNYRLLKASHEDKVYDLKSYDEHPEAQLDIYDDMMRNVISKRDTKLHGVEDARARTHLSLACFETTLNSYRHVCMMSDSENERRRWRVLEARYLLETPRTTRDIANDEMVSERTAQLDLQTAIDDLCVMLRGVDGLHDLLW